MILSSTWLIVCLSSCDFTSMCVIVRMVGLKIDAPSVGLPVFVISSCI